MSNTRILCLSMRFIYGFLTAEPDPEPDLLRLNAGGKSFSEPLSIAVL